MISKYEYILDIICYSMEAGNNMSKVLRYFLINKNVKSKNIKSLLLTIGIYIAAGICIGIWKVILGRVPLLGNVVYHIGFLYTIYTWIGVILSFVQCFGKEEYTNITYVTFDDVKAFLKKTWAGRNGKIILIVCIVLFCLIPHSSKGNKAETVTVKEDSTVEDEDTAQTRESQSSETDNDSQVENGMSAKTEQFYSYVKGCYEGDDKYYTFSILEGWPYYINSDSIGDRLTNDNYYIAHYSIDEFKCSDDSFEATLVENGKTHAVKGVIKDGVCTTMNFFDGSKEVTLVNTSVTSYDELLSKDYYKSCYLSAYYYDKERVTDRIYWFEYDPNEEMESFRYDISTETEGEELILKYENWYSTKFIVLGIKDGIVLPLYEQYSSDKGEVYDESDHKLWFFYNGGTSGGTGHYYMEYSPKRGSYHVVYATAETEERLAKLQITPVEDMDLCDRLIYELAQTDGLPAGYSSAIWDNMTFEFDGKIIEIGKTMLDDVLALDNWQMAGYFSDSGFKNYSIYKDTPQYVTFSRDIENRSCMITNSKKYDTYLENPLSISLKIYDDADFQTDSSNKIIYGFVYDFFTYFPEEINTFPSIQLMGDISYGTTYEEVYEELGMPAWICRDAGRQSCSFRYISEDYTKFYTLSFGEDGALKSFSVYDYSWRNDKDFLVNEGKQDITEQRKYYYDILQEKRSIKKGLKE